MPALRPPTSASRDSQASSIRIRPLRRQRSVSSSIGAGLPRRWTTKTARVRGERALSTEAAVTLSVSGETSASTGTAPTWTTGHRVVDQVTAGTTTSSSGPIAGRGSRPAGRARTASARRFAEDPELQKTASGAPWAAANSASNAATRGPCVTGPRTSASSAAAISRSPKVLSVRGRRWGEAASG